MADTQNDLSDYTEFWKAQGAEWATIINMTGEYIVFFSKADNALTWNTTRTYDDALSRPPYSEKFDCAKYNGVLNAAIVLLSSPCEGLSKNIRERFFHLVGRSLCCAYDFDYGNAAIMLEDAAKYFRARSEEMSRYWYLSAAFVSCAPLILVGLVLWGFRGLIERVYGADFIWLATAAVLGAVGALLSVILRSGQLKFDCSAGKPLHYLEAASRIAAGSVTGLLVALAVKYQLVMGGLFDADKLTGVMMLAALAGGAGERLAGSIISKFDSAAVDAGAKETKPAQT